MAQRKRRGFTIVELVIVIAVIAILAGVLIPTFASVIKKANEASDITLIKSLNKSLAAGSVTDAPENMHEALEIVKADGFDVEKIKATAADNQILWDKVNNCFVYVKDGAVNYVPDSAKNGAQDGVALWQITAKNAEVSNEYSNYLEEGYEKTSVTVQTGLDVGNNTGINVTYNGKGQNVDLRTNGGTLVVNETNSTAKQYFYGSAAKADVTTGNDCLHVNGTIAELEVKAGKVVAEAGSLVVVKSAAEGANVQKNSGVVVAAEGATLGTNVAISTAEEKAAYAYTIGSKAELIAFRDAVNNGMSFDGLTVKLTADIDMTGYKWTSLIGNNENCAFSGKFDGQGHKIVALSNGGFKTTAECENITSGSKGSAFGLFGYVKGNVEVSNLYMENVLANATNGVAGVISNAGKLQTNLVMKSVTVSGTIIGEDRVAGLVGYGAGYGQQGTMTFENCTNNANITGTVTRVAGIVASQGQQITKSSYVNCANNGKIVCTGNKYGGVAAGICAALEIYNTVDFTNGVKNIYKNLQQNGGFSYSNCTNSTEISAGIAYGLFNTIVLSNATDGVMKNSYTHQLVYAYKYGCIGEAYSPYDWKKLDSNNTYHVLAGIAYDVDAEYVFEFDNGAKFTACEYTLALANASSLNNSEKLESHCGAMKLLKDFTVTETYDKQTQAITIDLNGKTLTLGAQLLKGDGGVVEIKNGTIAYGEGFSNIALYPYGSIVLKNVTLNTNNTVVRRSNDNTPLSITIEQSNINAYILINVGAKLTLNGTEYTGSSDGTYLKLTTINGVLSVEQVKSI